MSEDINVTDGTVLEALNNKVDLDGGNYKGSELEAYIHEHCGGGGLEIGDVCFTQMSIDETKGKRRILNGQVIIQEQYVQFTEIIKKSVVLNPDLACTESEWQTEVTMSTNGVCYKFVIDDTAGTIRLPKYPNYFIAGLTGNASVVGNGKAIGLTNGTAYQGLVASDANASRHQLVGLTTSAYGANIGQGTSGTNAFTVSQALGLTSDPTKSGVVAKISNEQAELIKGNYFIQLATGSETEDNIINDIELNNPFFFGYYQFFEVAPNNISWLKSEGQHNSKIDYIGYYEWLNNEKANPTNIPAKANIVEEGNLTNRNGVLSGFNIISCAKLPSKFQPNSYTWEMIFKGKTGNDVTTGQYISALSKDFTTAGRYATRFGLKDSHFVFSVTYNGTAWDIPIESTIGTYTVQANTDYYVKFEYTGSAYVLSYSLDGDIYTEDINVTSSTPIYNDLTACLIGCWSNGDSGFASPWLGSIDLNETYININGVRWWSGMKSKVRLHTEDYDDYDWVINREEETFRLPIKVKLPSGKAVVGNGVGLGLTDGQYFSSIVEYQENIKARSNYGQAVGTVNTDTPSFINNTTLGVTTDPTKSGLELSDSDLSLYFYVGETVQNANLINAGRIEEKISSLIPDNSSLIAGYGMPSTKYIDLTLGASGTTYTAPANGWFLLAKTAGSDFYYAALTVVDGLRDFREAYRTSDLTPCIAVRKGDTVLVEYNATGTTRYFRFIYAQGESEE